MESCELKACPPQAALPAPKVLQRDKRNRDSRRNKQTFEQSKGLPYCLEMCPTARVSFKAPFPLQVSTAPNTISVFVFSPSVSGTEACQAATSDNGKAHVMLHYCVKECAAAKHKTSTEAKTPSCEMENTQSTLDTLLASLSGMLQGSDATLNPTRQIYAHGGLEARHEKVRERHLTLLRLVGAEKVIRKRTCKESTGTLKGT